MASEAQLAKEALAKGLWKDNPVFVQTLGLCPALAVSNSAINAVAMSVAAFFVLVGSSLLVSLVRKRVPAQVRITTFIVIIATFVTMADFTLQALAPAVHKELGAYIALIVVNCIILGRQEAFASRSGALSSVGDAVGMSGGFAIALLMIGSAREVLGTGTLFGFPVMGAGFEPWVIMILPPGGFIMMGLYLTLFAHLRGRKERAAAIAAAQAPEERSAA